MAYKNAEKQRRFQRKYYQENKHLWLERERRRRDQIRKELNDYKRSRGCSRCPENHPACLEFHHLDPTVKEGNIADLLNKKKNFDAVLPEIEKCELLCANCHRKEHHKDS